MKHVQIPPSGWIWAPDPAGNPGVTRRCCFRRCLYLEETPDRLSLCLSADSRYRFYVNGQLLAFGPCKGDGEEWYYEETDIAPYLTLGENVLAAEVIHYSPLEIGSYAIWRTRTPGFYLRESADMPGGSPPPEKGEGIREKLLGDDSWRCKMQEQIRFVPEAPTAYLSCFEEAVGDPSLQGWQSPGFREGTDWVPAMSYHLLQMKRSISPGNLLPRPIPQMFQRPRPFVGVHCLRDTTIAQGAWTALLGREKAPAFGEAEGASGPGKADESRRDAEASSGIAAQAPPCEGPDNRPLWIPADSRQVVELDAGALTTGFLTLGLGAGKDAVIKILTSESYVYEEEGCRTPRKGDRTDCVNGRLKGFTDRYQVGGFGREADPEIYEPFWFRCFRYVQLEIRTAGTPLQLLRFDYRETGYPLAVGTWVQTDDPRMSEIWAISLRSLRRCMHETYEDCPFYEQLQYAMDARTQILYTYSVSADDRMARRTMADFHRSLRGDGLTLCCFPSVNDNVIPGFSLYYIMMIHDHMMYFGDRDLVTGYLPTVEAILGFFHRNIDERGLVGKIGGILHADRFWSFIDWTPQWGQTAGVPAATRQGAITMESLLYAMTLEMAAELADFVGRPEQGRAYRRRAQSVKQAVNAHCLGENGLYQDGPGVPDYSQHCQVFAVLSGTAAPETHRALMTRTLREKALTQCSVAMAFYLFRAVEKAGLYRETEALWAPWRKMLRNRLTTCEEDQVNDCARSDCHAWGAVALYELPSAVLGVRPAEPGYRKALVRPLLGHLSAASGSVITPHGEIHVAWERGANGALSLEVNGPASLEIVG